MKKIIILIFTLVLILAFTGCAVRNSKKTEVFEFEVDLLMDAQTKGYSGHASLFLSVNAVKQTALYEDVAETLDDEDVDFDEERLKKIVDSLSFVCEENEELSNGDVVPIRTSFDTSAAEKYGIVFTPGEFTYTVSGLIVAEEVDPFEGLEIRCDGAAPNGTVSIVTAKCSSFVQNSVNFSIVGDQNGIYSNDDEVVIQATFNSYYVDEPDSLVILTPTQQTYTVSGLSIYPESIEGLDLSEVTSNMYDVCNTYIIENIYDAPYMNGNYDSTWYVDEFSFTLSNLLYLKPKTNTNEEGKLIAIFNATYTASGMIESESVNAYIAVEYSGFATNIEGTEITIEGEYLINLDEMEPTSSVDFTIFYNKNIEIYSATHIINIIEIATMTPVQ
jgi:hypothetical protein